LLLLLDILSKYGYRKRLLRLCDPYSRIRETGSNSDNPSECSGFQAVLVRRSIVQSGCTGDISVDKEGIRDLEPRKILIVDDEPALSALLCEMLEMEGPYRVHRAFNGLEGVEKYKEFSPDLVIMDMNMPVMNGYDSSRSIKLYDQDARILVLTGNPSDINAKKTIKEGFALALLEKPLRIHDLTRIVNRNLPAPS
jgi:two-component system, chemotaxis family, chemotaxis protein CheY